jgi:hypothetical protein
MTVASLVANKHSRRDVNNVAREPKEKWPNFFIVGAARSGTTSLYEYLKRVPGVYMSPVKEPRYFAPSCRPGSSVRPIRDKAEYLRLFQGVRDEAAVGEASITYLPDPEAPRLIHKVIPDARIIIILRDPVERAYSSYLLYVREGWQSLPFEEAVQDKQYEHCTAPGFYADSVKRYLDIFGAERVKILIFEEFIQDTKGAVRKILKFLGVEGQPPINVGEAYNAFAAPRGPLPRRILASELAKRTTKFLIPAPLRRIVRQNLLQKKAAKPPMHQEARKFLEELYREDVRKLERILGRSLPWSL